MVITGGEGSEALVTEYSGIAAVNEEDGVGTPAKEVMLNIIISLNCLGQEKKQRTESNFFFSFFVCLFTIHLLLEGGRFSQNSSTTLLTNSTL